MKKLRSMGVFISVCALICLTIAIDKYYSATKTAEELARSMPGFELQQVPIPVISILCGFIGVMLLVAGLICIVQSTQKEPADQ